MEGTTFDPNSGVFAFTVNHNSPLYIFLNKVPLIPHEGEEIVKYSENINGIINTYWSHRQTVHAMDGIEHAVIGLEFTYNTNNNTISHVTPTPARPYFMARLADNGDVCIIGKDEARVLQKMAQIYRQFNQDLYDESQVNAAEGNNYYE